MVLGAIYKNRVRAEALAEAREATNKEWLEWLRRKSEAEAKGDPFNEPSPAERPAETKSVVGACKSIEDPDNSSLLHSERATVIRRGGSC